MDFIYTIDPYKEYPVMMINGGIGDEINGGQFARELYTLDSMGVKGVKIIINSFGGNVVDGMAIFDAILNTECIVDTYCSGVALSIAAVIFLAGAKRYMADYSCLMFHNPYNPDGTEDEGLEMMRIALIKMIQRWGMDEASVEEILARETWMEPEEAIKLGFADESVLSKDVNKKQMLSLKNPMDKWKGVQTILNKFVKSQDNSKIMAKKIITTIDEKSKINALDMTKAEKFENKRTIRNTKNESREELEEEIEELEEKLEDMDDEDKAEEVSAVNYDPADTTDPIPDYSNEDKLVENTEIKEAVNEDKEMVCNLKNEIETLKAELQSIKNEKKLAEIKAMKDKVDVMIAGYVKAGKIANSEEDIKDWTAQALTNFDFTKRLIDRLPVTKAALKIPVAKDQNIVTDNYGTNFIAKRMAELQAENKKRSN